MTRVAYVCCDPGVPVFGSKGASVHFQGVLGALLRRGDEVTVLARRFGGPSPAGVRVVDLGRPRAEPEERERLLAAANDDVAAQLRAAGPFDVVLERHALWSWGAMEAAREDGAVGVLEVNAPLVAEQAGHRSLVHVEAAEQGVRRALAAAGAVVAVSAEVAARLPRGDVHVIPNGVDPERFARASAVATPPFTVGFVGTLKPWHGLDVLLDALARLRRRVPNARLLVVGDGPGRDALHAAAQALGDAIELTGAVDPAEVPMQLARMHVGVAPYPASVDHYFSPLKVLEYAAAGLPVVASRIGQVSELVGHGETGLLCAPGDAEAIAGALAQLALHPERAAAMGRAGRRRVLARYTWDEVVDRVLAVAGTRQEVAA